MEPPSLSNHWFLNKVSLEKPWRIGNKTGYPPFPIIHAIDESNYLSIHVRITNKLVVVQTDHGAIQWNQHPKTSLLWMCLTTLGLYLNWGRMQKIRLITDKDRHCSPFISHINTCRCNIAHICYIMHKWRVSVKPILGQSCQIGPLPFRIGSFR